MRPELAKGNGSDLNVGVRVADMMTRGQLSLGRIWQTVRGRRWYWSMTLLVVLLMLLIMSLLLMLLLISKLECRILSGSRRPNTSHRSSLRRWSEWLRSQDGKLNWL